MEPKDDNTKFDDLPAELVRKIAAATDPVGTVAMSQTSQALREQLREEARAAMATTEAGRVNTLAAFQAVTGRIETLPRSLRAKPLLASGFSIHHLPQNVRQQAIAGFRSLVATLGDACSTELAEVDRIAAYETAAAAVEAGENVQFVAKFFGITRPSVICTLEVMAINSR